jgi:hypothetical protein
VNWAHPQHRNTNENARLILYFLPASYICWKCVCSLWRACTAVLVIKCCFSDRNICYCDYVNAFSLILDLLSGRREFFAAFLKRRTLIYAKSKEKKVKRERLSVVENIYHSKMFFRSIWNTKRVPETWWGFGIAAHIYTEKGKEDKRRRMNERTAEYYSFFPPRLVRGRVEKERKKCEIK